MLLPPNAVWHVCANGALGARTRDGIELFQYLSSTYLSLGANGALGARREGIGGGGWRREAGGGSLLWCLQSSALVFSIELCNTRRSTKKAI